MFRLSIVSLLASLLSPFSVMAESTHSSPAAPAKPKVIFFDVNETLLDLQQMQTSVAQALGGRDDLLALWFSTMLHHSLVDNQTDRYHDFGEIGVAALLMVAQSNGIALSAEQAKTAIIGPLTSLPAHADVKQSLETLKAQGYTLVSLTNSSNKGVATQFKNAGLTDYFDKRLSVEDIKTYKPNLKAYQWALNEMNVAPEQAMLVAAHGWDIAGAKAAGMQAAFIKRAGKVLYPLAIEPDYVTANLTELVAILVQK